MKQGEDMKKAFFLFALLMTIGCGPTEPTPTPKPTSPPQTYEVTLKVTGGARDAFVTYHGSGVDFTEEVVSIPWSKTITYSPRGQGSNLVLSVTRRANSPGSLVCAILVDGRSVESDTVTESESMGSCAVWDDSFP